MLNKFDASANLATRDMKTARSFYESKLGFKPAANYAEEFVTYQSGNTLFHLYHSKFAGTNKATALSWNVPDLEGAVQHLKTKGVSFEHYPEMTDGNPKADIHTSEGMAMAWFKDPDGNILHLTQA